MKRVMIYCEDQMELAIDRLLENYRPELGAAGLVIPKPQSAVGAGNIKRSLAKFIRNAVSDGYDGVFCLLDLYNAPFEFPKSANDAWTRVKFMRQSLCATAPKTCRIACYPHVMVHDLEAWILADERPLRARLGKDVGPWSRPENVNLMKPPASVVKELFLTHLKKSYGKVKDGTLLFQKADPSMIYAKCASFRYFINDLRHLAGVDHNADHCLSCKPEVLP